MAPLLPEKASIITALMTMAMKGINRTIHPEAPVFAASVGILGSFTVWVGSGLCRRGGRLKEAMVSPDH